jgi:hypothetical protein
MRWRSEQEIRYETGGSQLLSSLDANSAATGVASSCNDGRARRPVTS